MSEPRGRPVDLPARSDTLSIGDEVHGVGFSGTVTGYGGPYSVILDDNSFTPMSLIIEVTKRAGGVFE